MKKNIFQRINRLLLPQERKTSIHIVISILANTLLDFVSLAALMPILYYLMEGMDNRKAALLFCALAITVIVIKCVVSTGLIRFRTRFLLNLYKRLSSSLYDAYFKKGLLFIREQGSYRLVHEVNVFCYSFAHSLLASLASMLGEGLLILMVLAALIYVAPMTALILVISFLPFALVYILFIQKKAKLYGREEQIAKREQYRLVSETYLGYSDLKVSHAYPVFSANFEEGMEQISEYRMKMTTLMRFPMLLSELAVIAGLTLMIVFGEGDIKILVGIFAIAAFRLLPAVRTILSGWTAVHNSEYILEALEAGLNDETAEKAKPETPAKDIRFDRGITLEHISYTYPDGENIFDDFSLYIRKGEQIGFSGASGIGKSTLFNLLLGFLQPDHGQIRIDDQPLDASTQESWLDKIGYVSQEVFIFNGTLAENITIGTENKDEDRLTEILKHVQLGEWAKTLPEGLDTQLGERGSKISGGQRQRIGLARALYRQVQVLLLDEATSSLDDKTESEIMETLAEMKRIYPGLTILSIAHRKSSLAQCDRIINIEAHEK